MPHVSPHAEPSARRWTVARVLLALAGVAVIAWLVRGIGVSRLTALLVPALPWLPIVALLELARIAMDAAATWFVLDRRAREVPIGRLFWAHVVGYAVMAVMPAGRSSAEATKAALLSSYLGGGASIAMGTTNQANTLLSSGLFTIPCAIAVYSYSGASVLMWACWAHFVVMFATGLAIRATQRHAAVALFVRRRFPKLALGSEVFLEASRETSLVPLKPVACMLVGRGFQAAAYATLALSVGLPLKLDRALAVQGVNLVSSAVSVLVPGQLGASEGVFSLAAEALGTDVAHAASIALLAHAVQLMLTLFGFLVLALWRSRGSDDGPAASPEDPMSR